MVRFLQKSGGSVGVKIQKPRKLVASAALISLLGVGAATATINFVGREEGEVLTPYGDIADVMTVCFGHTGRDIEDREYSPAECEALLNADLIKHAEPLFDCLNDFASASDGVKLSFISLAFNVGPAAVCNGSIARDFNSGDTQAACRDLLKYNKAGGKVIPALDARRHRELMQCAGQEE
jgi:lysozyme